MSINVIIADDHAIVREGVKAVLKVDRDIHVIGEASNGKEVIRMARENPAAVYLLDISMPLLNGIETTLRLVRMNPKNKVIILSMYDDRASVAKAMENGAMGYLVKETAMDEVVNAIHEVCCHRFYLSSRISKYIVDGFLGGRRRGKYTAICGNLSSREKEVLQLIAEGFSSKEISVQMRIVLGTVQTHRKNIMRKLDIHKQADLVRFALKEKLTQL
ncbi:MAG: response regulator transcription factor [Candidatus Omnitrophica bacterium]|nr:response regulator transcription factor [Candidatus Omnitrophota bacterium]